MISNLKASKINRYFTKSIYKNYEKKKRCLLFRNDFFNLASLDPAEWNSCHIN